MTAYDQYRDDLPLLAAGALSSDEAAALQRHVEQCADCRKELAALTEAVAQVGMAAGSVTPPLHLRERILSQVEAAPRSEQAFKVSRWPVWAWAPVFASLALAIISFVYWRKVEDLEAENRNLSAQVEENTATLQRSRALLQTLIAPDALHVTLTAAGEPAPPEVKTIYSASQHALVLTANNLAPLGPHKAYQLWLLPGSGAPVPYGTFKPDAHGNAVLVMTALEPQTPKAFAVTIEAETGSLAPTSPIILQGSL